MSSLVAMALRIAARRALEGATFAQGRVHDSSIAPIDHMVEAGQDEPFIVISSEDEVAQITNRDVTGGDRTVDLVFEIAIAHAVAATPEASGNNAPPPEIVIPATDAGLELSLSLISRQLFQALFEQKDNPWCDLFRTFCVGVRKITNRRGVGGKDGARFAARQIILTIDGLFEPPFGHEPAADEPWGKLLAQMALDPDLAEISPLIRSAIVGNPTIEDWDRGRSDQGLTDETAARIGISAASGLSGEEPPPLSEWAVE
jgi:hypothetical protein